MTTSRPAPRRILVAGPVPPIRGGIAQHTANLVTALKDAGHDVTTVSWKAQYPSLLYRSAQTDPNVSAYPGASFLLRWWSPLSWIRTGLRARSQDMVILPWVHPVHALPLRAIAAAASRRVPVVSVVHNVTPHERFVGAATVTRFFFGGVDAAVTQATEMSDRLRDLNPTLPIRIAEHPPNISSTIEPIPPRQTLRLLFMGYVRPYKGLELLLDALKELKQDPPLAAQLTVAGELWDPNEADLRRRIDGLGLTGSVDLRPGYVPDEDVPKLLAEHHAVVGPYRTATQSGVVPLAHAAGRPAVVTPVGGLPFQVLDGVNGIVASSTDARSLAAAIRRCAADLDRLADGACRSGNTWEEFAAVVVEAALA